MPANKYEVVIVGAGPAAWSTATFLVRANIKTLVIGDPAQSGLADAAEVWNYVGFPKGISGRELLEQMQKQATNQGATFLLSEVTHVEKQKGKFFVRTAERKEFTCAQLVLAHGANFIKVNLPGEQELVGKGIHYCALCDGPLYKGKQVIVLGNSNLAAEEALQLASMGVKITKIVTHAIGPNVAPEYQELLDKQGITVEIGKAEKFESGIEISIRKKDGVVQEKVDAVFIALGVASSAVFAQKLGLEMNGNFLKADENGRTNVAGVWVAGLARGGVNQVGKSVGEGIVAAVDIIKVAKGLPQYLDHT
jgi:thioredoxin reductase (NADPH)